jgi:glycerol-3-phosphate acyltransferase PlsX
MVKLAIDAMGGDYAPEEIVKGTLKALHEQEDLEVVLFGNEEKLRGMIPDTPRLQIVNAPQTFSMGEENPIRAIRSNKEASMVMAFQSVKDKTCQGVVTAGPTQCAIVCAHFVVGRLKGMKRVALCPQIPSFKEGGCLMLDVGANTDMKPEYLVQYALYADAYARKIKGIKNPKVYLLNIGVEPHKGRDFERSCYQQLTQAPLNFCGNIEPSSLLTSDADIVVTDGFTGNVAMKTLEGTAKAISDALKKDIASNLGGKIGYLFMKKNLRQFKNRFNTEQVGGAILFGVDGVVVKAHGNSKENAFCNAILLAKRVVDGNILEQMRTYIEENPIAVEEQSNE